MMAFLRNPRIVSTLACALLMTSLSAEETPNAPEKPNEVHVAVGSRPMDPEKIERIEAQKLQEAYEADQPQSPIPSELQLSLKKARFPMNGQSPFRLASPLAAKFEFSLAAFPVSCHWMTSKNPESLLIRLEDGSGWGIAASDYAVVNRWRTDDPLFITPITSWFISQGYYISNRANNTYVRANLIDGPLAFGPFSHWVTGIDAVQGLVFLENQTVWKVDERDVYILVDRRNNTEWAPNDHIIIMLFEDDHVLLNSPMGNRVRVRPY